MKKTLALVAASTLFALHGSAETRPLATAAMAPLLAGLVTPVQALPRFAPPTAVPAAAPAAQSEEENLPGIGDDADKAAAQHASIADPLESVNRAFFVFNDKLYFWLLKPVATGYEMLLPQAARRSIKNAFSNIRTPVRFGNSLLQGEGTAAWTELERLVINSTVGVLGLGDPAKNRWGIEKHEADLGQTFGRYGAGTSIFFCCPFIGPLNVRDGIGYAGDIFLDPLTYVLPNIYCDVAVKAGETVNTTSLRLGDYEAFKKASLDPYVAMRDAYAQYRDSFVKGNRDNTRPADALHVE